MALDLVAREPTGGRAKMTACNFEAEFLRHLVEEKGRVGAEEGTPTRTDAGRRIDDLPEHRRLFVIGRAMEWNDLAARDDCDLCAGFMEQDCRVDRRRTGAENGDLFAFELVRGLVIP